MSSQAFFWLNVGCGVLLILLFLVGRRGFVAPSRLNLRRGGWGGSKEKGLKPFEKSPQRQAPNVHFRTRTEEDKRYKNLNVIFMYNGHNFDAFEVLGAPAGASLEMAEKYLNQALARRGSDRDFLEAAFAAIKSDRG